MAEESIYKVKVTIGDAAVEIEGAQQGVVQIVSALKDIFSQRSIAGASTTAPRTPTPDIPPETSSIKDIRQFFKEKSPANDIEGAAVVAYYFQYLAQADEKSDTINSEKLERGFHLAQHPKPKVIGQTLRNTKKAGYLDSATESGEYRLNPVGYNLVVHTLGSGERRQISRPKKRTISSHSRPKKTPLKSRKKRGK